MNYNQSITPPPTVKTNGLAIASLVLGILAILSIICYGLGILFGIAALIIGLIARKQIKESMGTQGGMGMAITGIVMGAIISVVGGLAICAAAVIVILALMGPGIGNIFSNITLSL